MEIKVGDFLMSKDIGKPDIFWNVTKVYTHAEGHGMFAVQSKNNPAREDYFPLIFLDKYYIKVDATVVKVLFGNKDEKKTNKSIRK